MAMPMLTAALAATDAALQANPVGICLDSNGVKHQLVSPGGLGGSVFLTLN
jgi:hypothetical protein